MFIPVIIFPFPFYPLFYNHCFIFAKGIKFLLVFPYNVLQFGYSVGRFLQYIRRRELCLFLRVYKFAHQLTKHIHLVTFSFHFRRNRKRRGYFSIINIEIVLLQETPCPFNPFPDRLPRFTAIYFYIFKHVFRHSDSACLYIAHMLIY